MINHFCKRPLWEVTQTLAAVAQGREPADTVIRGGRLVNVCTAEILDGLDIAIKDGRIALVGDAAACIGAETEVIDADGQYVSPGFLDGHIHIESSMLSVGEYAKAVIVHGTVGIYPDPHEICNVLGLDGVRCMIDDAARTPLKCMFVTPSCVPAVPGFEDTGSFIGPDDVARTMQWPEIVGLGEMMNFPGILASDDHAHGIVDATLAADKVVTGHYSLPETGAGLNAYVASGVRCCHESTRPEDVIAKMRLGMYAQLRMGSAWQDLPVIAEALTGGDIDSRFACLVSDDTHPHTLISDGHMDHILRIAVASGIDPVTAIRMVTLNTAQCYRMDQDLGAIAPGKCADIVFLRDLDQFTVTRTIINGETVALNGKMTRDLAPYTYPDWARHSVHLKDSVTADTFKIAAPAGASRVTIRAIEVIPARTSNIERFVDLPVSDGVLESDTSQDVLKTFVLERHHETGTKGAGFVKGFGIKRGAMASTVAHDAHNLLVVGTNDADMALAANTLIACGGGMVAVQDGQVLGLAKLPIAGLMNDEPAEAMAADVARLEDAWKAIGCDMPSPFMTMALIPLACLPDLRLTNRGLVDCRTFQFVPLIVKE